jgi:hypothetical protein
MKKNNKIKNVSNRVIGMHQNSISIWGKNIPLEKFWNNLSSAKKVVLLYTNSPYQIINLPSRTTKKFKSIFQKFEENKDIISVLSSNESQDSYELYLYPKAKNKTVDYVIENYKKYFKPILPGRKLMVPY